MKEYIPRIADKLLADAVESKGAVLVEGPKWCGKTTTSLQLAKSSIRMDDPVLSDRYIDLFYLNPSNILNGDVPRLIDEWQILPKIWDAVRYEVDDRGKFGQFILTGSSVPADLSQLLHTGTGRIKKLRMNTMTLYESGESSGVVSLGGLFDAPETISGQNNLTSDDLAYLICRGGWPGALGITSQVALTQAYDYFDAVVSSDVSRVDGVSRDPDRARNIMRAYSRYICSQAKYTKIWSDVREIETSTLVEEVVYSYINALKNIFVIDEIPIWNPNIRSRASIRSTHVRNFCDPSVAVAALGVTPGILKNDNVTFGILFESMCMRDLKVYAQYLGGTLYHYRDSNDLECDAVIVLPDGRWGAIEVKLGINHIDEGADNLKKFVKTVNTEAMKDPSFLMVMSGTDRFAYRRPDGVYVVPAGCLRY
ncbi:MAG: DUF4143 domain-containing protein [Clostridia bacterium]|nr:DUF4143 domain-containing protein [Clostridia bacterium]